MLEPIVKCRACRGEGVRPGPKACLVCKGIGLRAATAERGRLAEVFDGLDELDEDELGIFGIRGAS